MLGWKMPHNSTFKKCLHAPFLPHFDTKKIIGASAGKSWEKSKSVRYGSSEHFFKAAAPTKPNWAAFLFLPTTAEAEAAPPNPPTPPPEAATDVEAATLPSFL